MYLLSSFFLLVLLVDDVYAIGFGVGRRGLPVPIVVERQWNDRHATSTTAILAKEQSAEKDKKSNWHFLQCALAGAISCSTTHGIMVPLDVIKTSLQTDASMAKMSMYAACDSIFKRGGIHAFFKGFSAIYAGYFLQGMAKFGFYEYFKSRFLISLEASNRNLASSPSLKLPMYIVSSGLAEIIASFALTPLEVVKIDMMSNPLSKGKNLFQAMSLIVRAGGVQALYKGLPLIMLRQVPYTCVKLAGYDLIVEALRRRVAVRDEALRSIRSNAASPVILREQLHAEQRRKEKVDLMLQFSSGVMAGVLSAVLSHPADVLLSKVCGGTAMLTECIIVQSPQDILLLMKDLGFAGCFNGVKTRAIMTAIITAAQFGIYERAKRTIMDITYDSRLDHISLKK